MRLVTTGILGVTVIVLAVVTWFVDRETETASEDAKLSNVLIRFAPDQVDRIVVEKGSARTVMEKKEGLWLFSEPEEDRVDAGAIAVLLDELNHLTILDSIGSEEEGMSPQQLGIKGDDAIKITVGGPVDEKGKERFSEAVILGVETPRSNTLFASEAGDDTIHAVNGNPRKWVTDPLAIMRDRRILGVPVEAIVQMVVRQSTGEIAVQRKITPPQQDWSLVKPIQAWADRELLDALLTELGALQIHEVVGNAEPAEKIPNPLPDNSAVFQIMVYGSSQPLTIYLKQVDPGDGVAPPTLEARISGRPAVYRFPSNFLTKLPESANDVRDRALARIPLEYLSSIIIQSRIDPYVYLKSEKKADGINWFVKVNDDLLPANMGEVSSLVAAMNEAAILDFASDSGEDLSQFGLNPPARRIIFQFEFPGAPDEQGNPGQVQVVERVLNLGWKEGDEQRLFANFEGENFVYELSPSVMASIPTHPLKWRSLTVLTFNPFHLESITREIEGEGTLKLTYDYTRDRWEATKNGVDVTGVLDIGSARRLRDRLGSLTAESWYLSIGQAYEALQDPIATFSIVTKELDRARGDSVQVTKRVKFAKIGKLYYGQIEGSPDVFILDDKTFGDLRRPVTGARMK